LARARELLYVAPVADTAQRMPLEPIPLIVVCPKCGAALVNAGEYLGVQIPDSYTPSAAEEEIIASNTGCYYISADVADHLIGYID
jgi:hypothetical protein